MEVKTYGALLAAVALMMTGCEWDTSSGGATWNDSMNWANFSGLYRSGSDSRALVANFSLSSGGTAGTTADTTDELVEYPTADQAGGSIDAFFTEAAGTIDYLNRGTDGWYIKAGSVDIVLTGSIGAVGTFTDDGSGALVGSYELVSGGGSIPATGTIDYDTGAWSITLDPASPFLEAATITYSYVVTEDRATAGGGSSGGDETPPTGSDWVYSLQVEQTGNLLRFIDNRGFVWEGQLISMTTPNGDSSGSTSGAVSGTFEATGVTDSSYKISGTFSGNYTYDVATDGTSTQTLTERTLQGIWMEPTGNGDLYGVTTDFTTTQ